MDGFATVLHPILAPIWQAVSAWFGNIGNKVEMARISKKKKLTN